MRAFRLGRRVGVATPSPPRLPGWDVSSVYYADRLRAFRLRSDPARQRERRERVFELGRYINDFCIVRVQSTPEADRLLTMFLGLLSD